MGERISATEDKVEEMLSVMGKENLKRKILTKGYCSAKGKHDLKDSQWHPPVLIDQCLVELSSDSSYYSKWEQIDPQTDDMQRVRHLGTLTLNGWFRQILSLQIQGILQKRKEFKGQMDRGHQRWKVF